MMTAEPKFVAPELQILTPSYMVGYLNGMTSLLRTGVSQDCNTGLYLGIRTQYFDDGHWRNVCPQGRLTWERDGIANVVSGLDVLLTGGRLSPVSRLAVENAYLHAQDGDRIQAAQQAIAMTTE